MFDLVPDRRIDAQYRFLAGYSNTIGYRGGPNLRVPRHHVNSRHGFAPSRRKPRAYRATAASRSSRAIIRSKPGSAAIDAKHFR
jgi:hypothetical protein